MRRRQYLARTGAAVTGAAVVGTTGATAAHDPPLVSTRGHFDDSGSLTGGHTAAGYDTDGTVPGVDGGCVDDLTVFVHGWDKDSDDPAAAARAKVSEAAHELDAAGYDGTVVGYTWDSDAGGGLDFGWGEAQTIARKNGRKLGAFALDFALACGTTIRFVSHSLGAQVLFSALRELDANSTWNDFGFLVWSVHLLGAAQDNEAPTREWPATFDAVRTETRSTYNYHSEADDVLQWLYNSFEFDQALGETGAESGNTSPDNYADRDATDRVGDDHGAYLSTLAGDVVADM